jgi:hypothetical protein
MNKDSPQQIRSTTWNRARCCPHARDHVRGQPNICGRRIMREYDRQIDAIHANVYDNLCYSSSALQYEKYTGKWQEQCCPRGGMALNWKKPWNRGGDAPRVDCECVCVLNISRYIFIVWRLSILSKLDSNNSYRIWAELYLSNLNYLIILDTWPIWPSWRPHRSRFTSWLYLSFRLILFATHLLVWPSYDNNNPMSS